MEMVSKDGELDDAQPEPVSRTCEAVLDDPEAPPATQIPDTERYAQGHEHRCGLVELGPALVRNARARRSAFSPRSLSLPAPLRQSHCELFHLIEDSLPNPFVTHHPSSGGSMGAALPLQCPPAISSRVVGPEVYFLPLPILAVVVRPMRYAFGGQDFGPPRKVE